MGSLCLNKHLWKVGVVFEFFSLLETETRGIQDFFPLPSCAISFSLSTTFSSACHHFIFYGLYKLAFVPPILSFLLIMGLILVPSLRSGLRIRFEIPRHSGAMLWNPRRAEGVPSLSWDGCSFFSEVHVVKNKDVVSSELKSIFLLTKCYGQVKEAWPGAFANEKNWFQMEVVCVHVWGQR